MSCTPPIKNLQPWPTPTSMFATPQPLQTDSRVVTPEVFNQYMQQFYQQVTDPIKSLMMDQQMAWNSIFRNNVGALTIDTDGLVRDPDYQNSGAIGAFSPVAKTEQDYSAAVGELVVYDNGADGTPYEVTLPTYSGNGGKMVAVVSKGGYINATVGVQTGEKLQNITNGTITMSSTGLCIFVSDGTAGWWSSNPGGWS